MKPERTIYIKLLLTIGLIAAFGFFAASLANMPFSLKNFGDPYHLARKDLLNLSVGMSVMLFFNFFDYRKLAKISLITLACIIVILFLVLMPMFSYSVIGKHRFFVILGFRFQPMEIAVLSVILYFAKLLSEREEDHLLKFTAVLPVLVVALLLALEPSIFPALLLLFCSFVLLLYAKRFRWATVMAMISCLFAVVYISGNSTRLERLSAWANPQLYHETSGYQVIQSLSAISHGGLWGIDTSPVLRKNLLPAAYSEFVFSAIAARFGLAGVLIIILLFFYLVKNGITITERSKEKFGAYLAAGITIIICVKSIVHFAVCLGLAPVTSIPLPLVSHGGSSTICTMAELGILLNISKQTSYASTSRKTRYLIYMLGLIFALLFLDVIRIQLW